MSLVRPVLNAFLRLTEKPYLARVKNPEDVRRSFERKARIYFHAPSGTQRAGVALGNRPALSLWRRGQEEGPLILYFHGGAYVFGSPMTHAAMLARLSLEADARVLMQDYRKAPEHPFPAAVEDAEAAWMDLLERGENPARVVIGGDSAGGGLALALLAGILRKGLPVPAGVFAFSPLTDMTYSGDSFRDNVRGDVILPASRVEELTRMYLADHDRADPRASPLFAEFEDAPPVFLAVGDTELLRDDTRRLAAKLERQRVEVEVSEMADLPHVWPIFHNILPEARGTLRQTGVWIRQQTGH